MRPEIVQRVEQIAREVAATAKNPAALPLDVFYEIENRHPDIVAHIRRYRRNVDPYQVVASFIPPDLLHPDAGERIKGQRQ